MKAKTKNIAVSDTIHYAHKLNCHLACMPLRETTEEALKEFWKARGATTSYPRGGNIRDASRKRAKKVG